MTPTSAGSKSGSPIAGSWFSMVYLGYNGLFNIIKVIKILQGKYFKLKNSYISKFKKSKNWRF